MNVPTFASRARTSFPVALFLVSVIGLFGPIHIYLTNIMEFSFAFTQALGVLVLLLVAAVAIADFLLAVLPAGGHLFVRGTAFACALGLAFWIQGNILVWRYGLMDGKDVDWAAKAVYGWIDTPVWLVLLGSAVARPGWWTRHAVKISLMFVVIQLVSALPLLGKAKEAGSFKMYSASEEGVHQFSRKTNVVVLIFDTFQNDVFQEILEKAPSYAEGFDGFTYFRNTLGGYPTTYGSISYLLTGRFYENQEPVQAFLKEAFLSPCSIPKVLMDNGFRVDLYPGPEKTVYFSPETLSNLADPPGVTLRDVAYLYGLTLFRYVPHFLKRHVHGCREWVFHASHPPPPVALQTGTPPPGIRKESMFPEEAMQSSDVRFMSDLLGRAAAVTDKNVFKFYHRFSPHPPIVLDEHMNYGRRPFNRSNYVEFAMSTLKMAQAFLDALRKLDVYEDSLVIIMGDHGYSDPGLGVRPPGGVADEDRGGADVPIHVRGSALPLLLVKPIGATGALRTSDAPVSLGDIPATIFSELGISADCPGRRIFDVEETARRTRRFLHYSWTHATWKHEYFPDMTEYEVTGFAWDAASWRPTGRTFVAPAR